MAVRVSTLPLAESRLQPQASGSTVNHRRVVIIGAGAVGSHLIASLRPSVSLMVLDPAEPVRSAFAARGIDTHAPAASEETIDRPPQLPFQDGDVAILATSAAAAAVAARSVPEWVPLVCVSNGLTPELSFVRQHGLSYGVVEFAVSSIGAGAIQTDQGRMADFAATKRR